MTELWKRVTRNGSLPRTIWSMPYTGKYGYYWSVLLKMTWESQFDTMQWPQGKVLYMLLDFDLNLQGQNLQRRINLQVAEPLILDENNRCPQVVLSKGRNRRMSDFSFGIRSKLIQFCEWIHFDGIKILSRTDSIIAEKSCHILTE
jgi:hypothetical protein